MFLTLTTVLTYTGMDGLTIGYGEGDVEVTTGTKSDENTMFANIRNGCSNSWYPKIRSKTMSQLLT